MKFSNSDVREIHKLRLSLGYRFLGMKANGHYAYEHDDIGVDEIAASPSDSKWRGNETAKLRRRHPDAPELARRKADPEKRAKRRKKRAPQKPRLRSVGPLTPLPLNGGHGYLARKHRCQDCGHPWVTQGHAPDTECPRAGCGSRHVVVGRAAA